MSAKKQNWTVITGAAFSLLVAPRISVRLGTAKKPGVFVFNRIATFPVIFNLCDEDPNPNTCLDRATVSEITAASEDGKTLIYTDALTGNLGFVDITNPSQPSPRGVLNVGGSPTSVDVIGDYALAAVDNTDGDFVNPAGVLKVIHTPTKELITIDLGGQPDSVTVKPEQALCGNHHRKPARRGFALGAEWSAARWIAGGLGSGRTTDSLEVTEDQSGRFGS
jgi:hypothetical protein